MTPKPVKIIISYWLSVWLILFLIFRKPGVWTERLERVQWSMKLSIGDTSPLMVLPLQCWTSGWNVTLTWRLGVSIQKIIQHTWVRKPPSEKWNSTNYRQLSLFFFFYCEGRRISWNPLNFLRVNESIGRSQMMTQTSYWTSLGGHLTAERCWDCRRCVMGVAFKPLDFRLTCIRFTPLSWHQLKISH